MSCYTPIKAFYDENGKVLLGENNNSPILYLPCGKCTGCRNDLTKDWAVRCYHESQLHTHNCVLTLTFDDENINKSGSLEKQDIVNFVKRLRTFISRSDTLRKYYPELYNKKISYLYCGEYGHKFNRPHYHIIIFGFDFPDKVYLKDSKSGDEMYTSEMLSKLWSFGFHTIGKMSMASAMYCASYITKFVSMSEREDLYTDKITGEMKQPEFGHASRRPALGLNWLLKYSSDITTHNSVIIANQRYRIPRYYLKKLEEHFPHKHESLKTKREELLDNTSPNLLDLKNKYTISMARLKDKGILKSPHNQKQLNYLESVLSYKE